MTVIVYNDGWYLFDLSHAAQVQYTKMTGKKWDRWKVSRKDPALVKIVQEMGKKANPFGVSLKTRELPAGTRYKIDYPYPNGCGKEEILLPEDIEWDIA